MNPWADEEGRARGSVFGMWVFLASEALLFGGLFALYAGYRAHAPRLFEEGCAHTSLGLGTAVTFVLLVGSLFAALATEPGRKHLLWITAASAAAFVGLKSTEYAHHLGDGLVPGRDPFWTLYWLMTGLHGVHVVVAGAAVVSAIAFGRRPQHVENTANFWHLVDLVWLFLWPMFYLMRGGG